MLKKAIAGALGAAAVAAAVSLAPSANAYGYYVYHTSTRVQWSGAECIDMTSVYTTGYGCGGSWVLDESVPTGADFGVDPIMGNASWISCQVIVDGVVAYTDYASAGDGTDVNCLRNKS